MTRNIRECATPSISSRIKCVALSGLLCGAISSQLAFAGTWLDTPQQVELSDGRIVGSDPNRIFIKSRAEGLPQALDMSTYLRGVIGVSADIAFPEPHSLSVDGVEFLMAVVGLPSRASPMGHCGSGQESTLYILQLDGIRATERFSELVESCWKNIDLYSDGTKSSFLSIKWVKVGFDIFWASDRDGRKAIAHYRFDGRRFVRTTSGR